MYLSYRIPCPRGNPSLECLVLHLARRPELPLALYGMEPQGSRVSSLAAVISKQLRKGLNGADPATSQKQGGQAASSARK